MPSSLLLPRALHECEAAFDREELLRSHVAALRHELADAVLAEDVDGDADRLDTVYLRLRKAAANLVAIVEAAIHPDI